MECPNERDSLILFPSTIVWSEVEPFASLACAVRASVPRVLINRDLVGPFAYQPQNSDVAELGDVVSGVEKVVELLGWEEELQELIKKETRKVWQVDVKSSLSIWQNFKW